MKSGIDLVERERERIKYKKKAGEK